MKELKISEFSFHEFLSTFQEAVIDGYRLDLDSNERFPQKYGSHLEVTLVQPEKFVLVAELPEEVPLVQPEKFVLVAELPEEVPLVQPEKFVLVAELPEEVPVVASLNQVTEESKPAKTRKQKD
jgi:hypothetical protein